MCFLCGKPANRDDRHIDRNDICVVTLIDFKNKLVEQCKLRNDDWAENVLVRLSCTNDLVADDGIYHKKCLTRFLLNWPSPESSSKQRERPADDSMKQWFNMLCLWIEVDSDGELYTIQELHEKMYEMTRGESVYSTKWLKTKLIERYNDSIYFAERNGCQNVVCFRDSANRILYDAWYDSRKKRGISNYQNCCKVNIV